jgi:hypothetical protein
MSEISRKAQRQTLYKSATKILTTESLSFSESKTYDIFLSHSFADAEAIYGIKLLIEEMGYEVYVDWVEDGQLDRRNVTKETATLVKKRMASCKSLFFATSETSPRSKWMPWELGFFDGLKAKVAILPVLLKEESTDSYIGQEYLSLYPYVTKDLQQRTEKETLWIHYSQDVYVNFDRWLQGGIPVKHTSPTIVLKTR